MPNEILKNHYLTGMGTRSCNAFQLCFGTQSMCLSKSCHKTPTLLYGLLTIERPYPVGISDLLILKTL